MIFCEYCQVGDYYSSCYCKKTRGELCPFVRRCTHENRWKPLEGMETCTLKQNKIEEVIELNQGEYKVVSGDTNKLYIEYAEGSQIRLQNPYDYIPKKVELVEVENTLYIKGFEPVTEKIVSKRKSNRKGKDDE